MNSIVRGIGIMVLSCAVTFIITGCGKHPPAAEPGTAPLFQTATPADKQILVAKVNGAGISRYSLLDMMDRMNAINQKMSAPEPAETVRKKALDQLVLQELALQEAARQGLSVDDMTVDRALEQIIKKLGHEEGYRDFLEKRQSTAAEFRDLVARSLLVQLLLTREVVKKAGVTEDRMRMEYDQHPERYRAPERFIVIDVVLPPQRDNGSSMKKAEEVLSRLQADKDKDPRDLAPDGTVSVRTLDSNKDTEPFLYEAARKLKRGELSGVLRTPDGLHVIKLSDYTPQRQLSYDEVKGAIERALTAEVQQKRRQEWEQELKKDATIELLDHPEQREQTKP